MTEQTVPRQTTQRRAIREVLEQAAGPLTPQEILERASRDLTSLGLATVYRNLNSLLDAGEVKAVHLPGDPARFEPARAQHRHHFRCEGCAAVFVIDEPCPVQGLEGVTLPGGFKVAGHALTLYGTCPDCQPGAVA